MNNQKNTDLSLVLDMTWTPTLVSESSKLSDTITSPAFQGKLKKMLSDYDDIEPSYIEEYQSNYVSLADRIKVLEDNFEFGDLWFGYEFIDRESANPVCVCTLYVQTESGFEPWINRMGVASSFNVSTDGALADAEVSSKRRVLAALGMGNDSDADILQSKGSLSIKLLEKELEKMGMSAKSLIKEYRAKTTSRKLTKLSVPIPIDDEFSSVVWGNSGDADSSNLIEYLKSK